MSAVWLCTSREMRDRAGLLVLVALLVTSAAGAASVQRTPILVVTPTRVVTSSQ